MNNTTNLIWQIKLQEVYDNYDYVVKPRGMEVREKLGGMYKVLMPAYLDLAERNINQAFMFAEAAWIISGSNQLREIQKYMDVYKNFSDDGIFLRGAYGPKVVDQLPYVIDAIVSDVDTRQAVMTIWRERPGASKDIPCTVACQFLVREGKLHMITTMRSNDIVLGFTYDIFTFSMIANAVRLLLKVRGVDVSLGHLQVNTGSLHIYEKHYKDVEKWVSTNESDESFKNNVDWIMRAETYEDLIEVLKSTAYNLVIARNKDKT